MLKIYIPDCCVSELQYSIDVLVGEFLGCAYQIEVSKGDLIRITKVGDKKELTLSACFFTKADRFWLKPDSMPELPLQSWVPSEDGILADLIDSKIPVLYGGAGLVRSGSSFHLKVDIFGSAFFILSRYEELISIERDVHQRFPATASIAFKENFLERPIVDEYVEIFWACLIELWPELKRKDRVATNSITCDVDWPFDPAIYSLNPAVRKVARLLLKEGKPITAIKAGVSFLCNKLGFEIEDKYREAISWIMDVNENAGNRVSFYFITQCTSKLDSAEDFNSNRMRKLFREIVTRGHEIGLHPGYETFSDQQNFSLSVDVLKRVIQEEVIKQTIIGGRQHFLRWDAAQTPHLWEENGLDYDSTLTYADKFGFRCGTCHDFNVYDLINRKKFKLKQRPLTVMECTIISPMYEGLGYSEMAFARFKEIKQITKKYKGRFTLLWHNSHFENRLDKEFYMELIK